MRPPESATPSTIGEAFKVSQDRRGGPQIVRAARDPIGIPSDPAIVELASKALCHLGLGVNCFTLTNVYGIEVEVPYGATLEQWQAAADKFLKQTMENDIG